MSEPIFDPNAIVFTPADGRLYLRDNRVKPATIGTDMHMDALDRKLYEIEQRLAKLKERVDRLEARNAQEDRDVTEGRRLVIGVLRLLLRRLEAE